MGRIRCWRCDEEQAPALSCVRCDAVLGPPRDADHFATLGLPRHPAIDEAELAERYYELSRKVHPDRFQTATPREQAESVRATAAVNAAFQTLRDVESRGRYWLGRLGEDLGRDNNRVPPDLAADVFEIQEKLAELRAARVAERDELRAEVARTGSEITDRRNRKRRELEDLLRSWPGDRAEVAATAPEPANGEGARQRLKSLLSELSYLRTLDRDVRSVLEE